MQWIGAQRVAKIVIRSRIAPRPQASPHEIQCGSNIGCRRLAAIRSDQGGPPQCGGLATSGAPQAHALDYDFRAFNLPLALQATDGTERKARLIQQARQHSMRSVLSEARPQVQILRKVELVPITA